jgi:hypothetical protein
MQRIFTLMRGNEMDVRFHAACGDNLPFARNNLGPRPNGNFRCVWSLASSITFPHTSDQMRAWG